LAHKNMSSWAVDLETAQQMAQDILVYRKLLSAKPRCGDCAHADNSWPDDGETYCSFVEQRKPIDWHCADFEPKGSE
jgi:hypothetical protein